MFTFTRHNYIVEVILQAQSLDERGFIIDYNELSSFGELISNTLDHRHLNDVLPCQTSAENIAKYLYDWAKERWPDIKAVRVSETPKIWSSYKQEDVRE